MTAGRRLPGEVSRESPLNIPLVRQMLEDPHVTLVRRSVDADWWYNEFRPTKFGGFNPFRGEIYLAARSATASWLDAGPCGPSRRFNLHDSLIYEVLFAAHDYLHGWAARAVRALAPQVGFGTAEIAPSNVEDLAFCHILTEACATTGLDYWYLSTLSIEDVCDIGTERLQSGLTVSFSESRIHEYRRYNPSLNVQRVEFFDWLARFYCSGELWGFKAAALTESMLTRGWLAHEMKYSRQQRVYIRQWLEFLSGGRVPPFTDDELKAPLSLDAPWRADLMKQVGQLLWEKVKGQRPQYEYPPIPAEGVWRAPRPRDRGRPVDFRFTNLNALIREGLWGPKGGIVHPDSFLFFAGQYASRFLFREYPEEGLRFISAAVGRRDAEGLAFLLRGLTPLEPADEPIDLFFIN